MESHSYIAAAQPCFSSLQECAARLAGLLMTAELRKSRHMLDLPSLQYAEQSMADARERLATMSPSANCRHFHHHLSRAFEHLSEAISRIHAQRAAQSTSRDPLLALQEAWRELTFASRALPGFETVDFRQSCCSIHHQTNLTTHLGGAHG